MKYNKHIHRWIATTVQEGHYKATVLRCSGCPALMVQSYPGAVTQERANPQFKVGRMALVDKTRKELGI